MSQQTTAKEGGGVVVASQRLSRYMTGDGSKYENWLTYSESRLQFEWGPTNDKDKPGPREDAKQRYGVTYLVVFFPDDNPFTPDTDESEDIEVLDTYTWDGRDEKSPIKTFSPKDLIPDKTGLVVLLHVNITVRKQGEDKAPDDGLIIKKDDVIEIRLTDITQPKFPTDAAYIKWFIRKLKWDGTYTGWSEIGETTCGVKFNHTCSDAGIFQVKCQLRIGSRNITTIFDRDYDDPNTTDPNKLNKGDPDCFGVVETTRQIDIRSAAKSLLGSTYYSAAGSLPRWRDPLKRFTGLNKCNVFVADMCDEAGADVDPPVAGVYIGSPPSANNWAGMPDPTDPSAPYPIPNFALLPDQSYPQPGFVAASGNEDPPSSGHVGIVDYDGRWISAGSNKVNRNANFRDHRRKFISGTKAAGQRRYDGK